MATSDEGYQHIEHGFEPVFDECSRVLVLGSFPSVLSRANAFYYGNPQNRFWRVMAACLGVPVPPNEGDLLAGSEPATLDASIAAKRFMLLNGGVALWDVIESCDIKGSRTRASKRRSGACRAYYRCSPIEVVVCNGGTAGRLYKRYLQERTGLPAIVLPSTSPANAAWRLERLVERWRESVDWVAL
ncbi:MAG: DNA-deoxyinosine glycosylase [Collinsella sp.]